MGATSWQVKWAKLASLSKFGTKMPQKAPRCFYFHYVAARQREEQCVIAQLANMLQQSNGTLGHGAQDHAAALLLLFEGTLCA